MQVSLESGRSKITGTFSELGRLKAKILNSPGSPKILNQGRDFVEISMDVYLIVRDSPELIFEEELDFTTAAKLASDRYRQHKIARDKVYRNVKENNCLTGNDHWDDLLDPHQGVAVNCMATDGLLGMCLFDEQGTGKTITGLAAFDLLRSKALVDSVVIVAPKTLLENWKDEALNFLPEKTNYYLASGNKAERFKTLKSNFDIYLLTYENLAADVESFKSIGRTKNLMLMVDESFFIKNPEAMRSKAAMELRGFCKKCFVLCGTPAPNKPSDLIHQFTLADNGFTFGDPASQKGNEIEDYSVIESLIETRGVYLRRTKKMVLPDLPQKDYHIIELDLSSKQRALYDEAKTELILFLKSLDNKSFKRNLTTYFQKRNALLQICVDPLLIDPLYNEIPCKFLYLTQKLEDIIERQNEKVVLWSVYTKTIDRLMHDFAKYDPARIDGKVVKVSDRQRMVEKFQKDTNCKIFVGNPAAAGAGITLHKSSISIYISYSNQAAHYMQSLDRTHRRGQLSDSVEYFFLVGKDTIESREIKRLIKKQESQNSLLGDSEEEILELREIIQELEND